MIEVLVSLVILAVGVLGLAGLQFLSLKYNRSSYERAQATSLAYELADRMRVNPTQARLGNYAYSCGDASSPAVVKVTSSTTPAKDCSTASCSADELKNYDRTTWCVHVVSALAGSYGISACADPTCAINSQHRVTVAWPEAVTGGVDLVNCPDSAVAGGYSCVTVAVQP